MTIIVPLIYFECSEGGVGQVPFYMERLLCTVHGISLLRRAQASFKKKE